MPSRDNGRFHQLILCQTKTIVNELSIFGFNFNYRHRREYHVNVHSNLTKILINRFLCIPKFKFKFESKFDRHYNFIHRLSEKYKRKIHMNQTLMDLCIFNSLLIYTTKITISNTILRNNNYDDRDSVHFFRLLVC